MSNEMPNSRIEILGQAISRGKGIQLNLDIAKLHTRTRIQVPVMVHRAKKAGPALLITGGIHGNEVNGIEIVRQIISRKFNKPDAGMVICIPVFNVFGFLNQKRQFPDGRDLNRVFPGSPRGSLASRFAYHVIREIAPLVDYCIDYHTGGESRFNIPQVRINKEDTESLELARVFGAPFVLQSVHREKSFRETMHSLKKRVLLFEGGKSLHLDRQITEAGVAGALRLMKYLGMRDFTEELNSLPDPAEPILIQDSRWVRAKYSGMFHPTVDLGTKIEKGEILGSITDPFGYFERFIKARFPGYLICINQSPIVNQGDAILHLARA